MKKIFTVIFILVCVSVKAQIISLNSAKYHDGSLTTVCEKVESVFTSKKGTLFINFGAPYPDYVFTGVVMAKDSAIVSFETLKTGSVAR